VLLAFMFFTFVSSHQARWALMSVMCSHSRVLQERRRSRSPSSRESLTCESRIARFGLACPAFTENRLRRRPTRRIFSS